MTRKPRGAAQLRWRRQRQEQARRWPTLNLVALMDVFTILVLFFLLHSTDGTPDERGELVRLPESVADQLPRDTPIVTITRDTILLQGEPVATVDAATQISGGEFEGLRTALQAQLAAEVVERAEVVGGAELTERELTIKGDQSIPFDVLNRVMHTCTRAGYGNISLSVLQRATGAG